MSISVDIRNLKTPSDKARKLKDYKEYLKLQQKLNTQSDIAFKALSKGQSMGIKPSPAVKMYASAEEAQQDITDQRNTALGHLRTIFPYGTDATKALEYLNADRVIGTRGSELTVFNGAWSDFQNELKGMKDITPSFFNELWDRYKTKLSKTAQTGIQIPIDSTDFNTTLNETKANLIQAIEENRRLTKAKSQQIIDTIRIAVDERNTDLLGKIQNAIDTGNLAQLEIIIKETGKSEEVYIRSLDRPKLLYYAANLLGMPEYTGSTPEKNNLFQQLGLPVDVDMNDLKDRVVQLRYQQGVEYTREEYPKVSAEILKAKKELIKQERDEIKKIKTSIRLKKLYKKQKIRETRGLISQTQQDLANEQEQAQLLEKSTNDKLYLINEYPFAPPPDLVNAYQATRLQWEEKLQDIEDILAEITRLEQAEKTGSESLQRIKEEEQKLFKTEEEFMRRSSSVGMTGRGMVRQRIIYGRGIPKSTAERYREFGRYIIHIPSLKKSILNIKFKSRGYIPQLPTIHISEELRMLIEEVIETQRLPVNTFNKLTKNEQKLFEKVAQMALIDDVLGLKVDNSEKKEAIKRYEILRGEMLAGNDNEEIRKELKTYLIRFMNENLIPRKEGMNVLLELSAMG